MDYFINQKSPVFEQVIRKDLAWSRNTFYRTLKALRQQTDLIRHQRGKGGYWIEKPKGIQHSAKCSLSPEVLSAVSTLLQVSQAEAETNNLQEEWGDFRLFLWKVFLKEKVQLSAVEKKIRILPQHRRKISQKVFQTVCSALCYQQVLSFHYQNRWGHITTRKVSPQRLVLYRNGWSLDAWCHQKESLRQFALDGVSHLHIRPDQKWKQIEDDALNNEFFPAYGLFSGPADKIARIQFTGIAEHYVRREEWHKKQKMIQKAKPLILDIPYHHVDELLGDVLRWGAMADVLSPPELVDQYRQIIQEMGERWE